MNLVGDVRNNDEGEEPVTITCDDAALAGDLVVPEGAKGIVLFAHGSGSSRFSPRNRYVAGELRKGGLATLLLDLLTPAEEQVDRQTRHLRFDIGLLGARVIAAVDWLSGNDTTDNLETGCFGASTGAAAALVAAAERPGKVKAVVSRGGRGDLAEPILPRVEAPSLFIVGERDAQVLQMNRNAMMQMNAETRLEIVPGAGHLFEEPGALEKVAVLAREWFARHLVA